MKKRLLWVIGLILIFGFGLSVTSCDDLGPVVIFVTNDTTQNITVYFYQQLKHEDGTKYEQLQATRYNIDSGSFARYEGDGGDYRIQVTNPSSDYYYPSGGKSFVTMEGDVFLIFDGNSITPEKR